MVERDMIFMWILLLWGEQMKFLIPDLNTENAIELCNELDQYRFMEDKTYKYCFNQMTHFEPFAMLVTINKLHELKKCWPNAEHSLSSFDHCAYGANMGFFDGVGIDFGKGVNHSKGSSNHIPVTRLSLADFEQELVVPTNPFQIGIEEYSKSAARILTRQRPNREELEIGLQYLIREMIRNTFEHSGSNEVWIAAQGWPSRNRVEVAIVDSGNGIKETLASNGRYYDLIIDDHAALTYGILPGVTRKFSKSRARKRELKTNYWANSGFGLYMTSSICDALGGEFVIMSGDKALTISGESHKWQDTKYSGTAIKLSVPIEWHGGTYFEYVMDDILEKGEMKAKELSDIAQSSASSASKVVAASKLLDK